MAAKSNRPSKSSRSPKSNRRDELTVIRRDLPDGPVWEFVQPRCGRQRLDDIAEVEAMIEAGEAEIAAEELVWLLTECPDFLEAHLHLGLLALEADDPRLARGHFGRAFELCTRALKAAGNPRPVPYRLAGNRAFHEVAKGLVHCLLDTGRHTMAREVSQQIAQLDPTDPLGVGRLIGGS